MEPPKGGRRPKAAAPPFLLSVDIMLYFSICTALVDFLQDHATPYGFWPALPVNIEGIIYMQDLPHLRALYSLFWSVFENPLKSRKSKIAILAWT